MKRITRRQEKLLDSIIKEYNRTLRPVGSRVIMDEYMPEISSQTIRIEMAKLEYLGLLEKAHVSSGRIPSTKGFQYYDKNISVPTINDEITQEFNFLFNKDFLNIDDIIQQSLNLINKMTGFLSLSNSFEEIQDRYKMINLVELDKQQVLLIFITHSGNIVKNIVTYQNEHQLEDLIVSIKIFNQKLKDIALNEIYEVLKDIESIMKEQLNDYNFINSYVIQSLFNINMHMNEKKRIVGVSSIFNNPEFRDLEKIQKIIESIEVGSIWEQIKQNVERNLNSEHIAIEYKEDLPISIATADIKLGKDCHQISVIGSNKSDLRQIKGILEFLTDNLEKMCEELKVNEKYEENKDYKSN